MCGWQRRAAGTAQAGAMDRNVGGWGETEVAGSESFCLTLDTSIRDEIHLFPKLGIQLRLISEASQSQGEDSTAVPSRRVSVALGGRG